MSDVSIFELDGTSIDVKDSGARLTAQSALSLGGQNAQDIADLKALSRLTVSYNAQTETIAFSTQTH